MQLAEVRGFSPDGSILIIEHQPDNAAKTLILRDTRSGQVVSPATSLDSALDETIPIEQLEPPSCPAVLHAFSSDGRLLAAWLDGGNVIKILDTATWKEKTALRQDRASRCSFFPDGKTLLIETAFGFTIWDASKSKRLATMEEWCDGQNMRSWTSPDGSRFKAILHREPRKEDGACLWQIGIWDSATRALQRQIERSSPGYADFEIAPDGQALAAVDDRRIDIEDIETGRRLAQLQLPAAEGFPEERADYALIGWSADSRSILITRGEGTHWLWDIRKPTAVPLSVSFDVSPICSSPDGKLLATERTRPAPVNSWILQLPMVLQAPAGWCFGKPHTLHPPSQISLREMSTGRVVAQATLDRPWVVSMAFTPDGSSLVASDSHGRVLLYDVPRSRR